MVYALIGLGLFVFAVVDLQASPASAVRSFPKWLWWLLVLPPVVGPVAWLLAGRPDRTVAQAPSGPPARTLAPDDDEDFLRELRRRTTDPRDDVV